MKYIYLNPDEIINTSEFDFVMKFIDSTNRNFIGWHYLIDLAWILARLKKIPPGSNILDAGGGHGPLQFLLLELGYNVFNLDLVIEDIPYAYKQRYYAKYEVLGSFSTTSYSNHMHENYKIDASRLKSIIKNKIKNNYIVKNILNQRYNLIHNKWRNKVGIQNDIGILRWKKSNLINVPEIPTNKFDAIVSLSSIEHIPLNLLPSAWSEILRICKEDSIFAVTTSGTEKQATWFHEPSNGYCFSKIDIENIFNANNKVNKDDAKIVLENYENCKILKDNLSKFYFKSGNNGMPWGDWKPKYIPIGLYN